MLQTLLARSCKTVLCEPVASAFRGRN